MSDPKREQLEAEAREIVYPHDEETRVEALADWAERREREAVAERDRKWVQACLFPKPPSADLTPEGAIALVLAEERKTLQEIVRKHGCTDHRHNVLAALAARASQDPSPGVDCFDHCADQSVTVCKGSKKP